MSDGMSSLGLFIGPYRNLTTLTASALFLHPNVQVLNHAGDRLLSDPANDFIARPNPNVLDAFRSAALAASVDGARGDFGGSILHAHAFDEPGLKAAYRRRFGEKRVKDNPTCLVWKESMRVQRLLVSRPDSLPAIVANLPDIRFILPIRQPIDCALSNMKSEKLSAFMDVHVADVAAAVDAVLAAIAWGLRQRDNWPDRFLVFTEGAGEADLPARLARHLRISNDAEWAEDFRKVFRVRPSRASREHAQMALGKMRAVLGDWPEIVNALADEARLADEGA